jgi:Icc protein
MRFGGIKIFKIPIMRIVFITDLHIDTDISRSRGIDNLQRFEVVLRDSLKYNPELIVLGGDLCNMDGELETYQQIKTMMDAISVAYHVISGNHDDSSMINNMFYNEDRPEAYRSAEVDHWQLIYLDSSKGRMSSKQWTWLEASLTTDKRCLVFMHHPPVICGSAHMEPKYSFEEIAEFSLLCKKQTRQIVTITGHFHMDRVVVKDELSVFVTPSTFLQIDPNSEALKVDTSYAAYRVIDLVEDDFRTFLVRVGFENIVKE